MFHFMALLYSSQVRAQDSLAGVFVVRENSEFPRTPRDASRVFDARMQHAAAEQCSPAHL
jgi:hypothetical protein